MGDPNLGRRGGRNQPPRTGSGFSIEVDKSASLARRVTRSPFVLVQHEASSRTQAQGQDDFVVLIGMALTIGTLFNNTANPVTVEIVMVDGQGREMPFAAPVAIPGNTQVPLILQFVPQLTAWCLAENERVELRVVSGDLDAPGGFWFWSNKQYTSAAQMVVLRELLATTSPVEVVVPDPGVTLNPPGFVFNGPFIGATVFNYSQNATTVTTSIETDDGDLVLEGPIAVLPGAVTPLLSGIFGGWNVSWPQKLKVQLGSVPAGGDVVFAANYQRMDMPAAPAP